MSVYPGAADDLPTSKTDFTGAGTPPTSAVLTAAEVNLIGSAVEAVQGELGTNPSGTSATVAARLDAVDTALGGKLGTGAGAVGTANLADGSVTAAKVAADVATQAELDAVAAAKANTSHVHSTADLTSGTLGLARGGTGGTDAATARTSLGLGTAATQAATAFAPVASVTTTLGGVSTATTGTLVAGQMAQVDATAAAAARTLPAANSVAAGTVVGVKKVDGSANAVTVSRAGADTITGTALAQTSRALTLAGESVEFTSDGASVWVITSTDTPSPALTATYAPLPTVRRVSTSTTAVAGEVVIVDATGGSRTVTLPAAAVRAQTYVKKSDASGNAVLVVPDAGATIDGLSSVSIAGQYDSLTFLRETSTSWVRV